jgi:hypothetical protein
MAILISGGGTRELFEPSPIGDFGGVSNHQDLMVPRKQGRLRPVVPFSGK